MAYNQNKKNLIFDPYFNEPIDHLPEGVEEIYFAHLSEFNYPLDNLPQSLKLLKLGMSYNQPLDLLPSGLETLILSYYYKYPMINFPVGLKYLGLPPPAPPPPFGKHLREYKELVGNNVIFFTSYPDDYQ